MYQRVCIKPDTCIACRRCETACIASHHNLTFKEAAKRRKEFEPRCEVIKTAELKTSVRCHQCNYAPCCNICPTNALFQDENDRIHFREELCIACEMCVRACPYGDVRIVSPDHCNFQEEAANNPVEPNDPPHCRETALRCDLCEKWREANGKEMTACMEACPVQALYLLKGDGAIVEAPKPQKKAVEKKPEEKAE